MTTVLIVDDEPDIVSTLRMVLQIEGYEVLDAPNGRAALTKIAEVRPDIILSDLMMPFMTGLELLAAVKENPESRTIPVVLMSAGRPNVAELVHPCDGFLAKPIGLDELLTTLAALLGRGAAIPP